MPPVRSLMLLFAFLLSVVAQPLQAGPLPNATNTRQIFAGASTDSYTLAVRATVWGYPLVRAAQLRQKATQPEHPFAPRPTTLATAPINRIGQARDLAGPDTRIGVAPNNDTLYSLAFLDMQAGPFQLDTPDFGTRYYVFQFGDADSETRQSYGQSSHGGRLPPIFIVGPDYRGEIPKGVKVVRSAQRYLMVAGRILVDGSQDLPNVHRLQDAIRLHQWSERGRLTEAPITSQRALAGDRKDVPDGLKLLASLGTVLEDWRVSKEDAGLVASLRRIGLTVENGFRYAHLPPDERAAIERGVADGLAIIREKTRHLGTLSGGWSTSYAGSRFGRDFLLRAAVAMDQIYVLDKGEALYPVAHLDAQGRQLDGRNNYALCFRKQDLPPVDGFWSITLYYEKGFLAANPIDRYSIGDRTPGLAYGPDGSLRLLIQNDDPGADKRANWLPAPREPFMLMMRLYRPKAKAAEGGWHPPAIQPIAINVPPASGGCGAP
ncbi:DUF1254 domain-containing protein [Sphingobium indicum]|uniref:Phosphatidylserine decarboxylase n=2 Tax=Sphingobium indicum TaxID=332055 RepID=A0A1L5BTA7_SPHIB|nr:DUF1214 domain-containing protein [Sphingobium indicum]APL96057.1 hypothetical protein SIDU_16910 [Sphingobium indicum B90A]NYI24179.1 hypothetical protein [Sphingobium indicum]